jgi:hypothetical protein
MDGFLLRMTGWDWTFSAWIGLLLAIDGSAHIQVLCLDAPHSACVKLPLLGSIICPCCFAYVLLPLCCFAEM